MEAVDRKQPAIVGGMIVGVLSVIPVINLGNFCCCLWALVGGIIAAKLLIDRSPQPVKAGDGAMIGLMAGLIGGGIYVVIGLPLSVVASGAMLTIYERLVNNLGNPDAQEMMRRMIEQVRGQSLAQQILGSIPVFIVGAFVLAGFTTLGGLLGVALFEKRKGDVAPPPPPQYPPQYPPQSPPNYPPATPPPPPSAPPPGEGGEPGSGSV